ncbi:MAG: Ig-like domain-containing protein [Bacteroidia bacterium]
MRIYFTKYFLSLFRLRTTRSLLPLSAALLLTGCAQIVPLSGGDKDVQAPGALEFIPANRALQVSTKTMLIEFDEYIQLRDLQSQLIVTPQLKELPEVNVKGKSLAIHFKEALQPNTTYYMNFGNAITDLHEGNAVKGFEYVFSTGPQIDTLMLRGKLTEAFTLLPVKDAFVLLYPNGTDSSVFKDKPAYLGKSESDGTYSVHYVKPGSYKIVALRDNNKNFVYDPGELIGFNAKDQFELAQNDTLNVELFREQSSGAFLKKVYSPYYGRAEFVFSGTLEEKVELFIKDRNGMLSAEKYKSRVRPGRDTLTLYYHDVFGDTLTAIVKHGESADTTRLSVLSNEEVQRLKNKKRIPLELQADFNAGVPQAYFRDPGFRINRMINKFDPSRIVLIEETDTLHGNKLKYRLTEPDSFFITDLKPEKSYQVFFYPGAFTDHLDISNDTITYKFKTQAQDFYSTLTVNVAAPLDRMWVLQLYNSKGKLAGETAFDNLTSRNDGRESEKLSFYRLDPDTYTMKLIEDKDGNRKFTTGNYFRKINPERVINYSLPVKLTSDWEMEIDWKVGN